MVVALKVFEKSLGGKQHFTTELRLASRQMTALQLIEHRVDAYVASLEVDLSSGSEAKNNNLVTPTIAESILNGVKRYGHMRPSKASPIKNSKWLEKENLRNRAVLVEEVVQAFSANQMIMLVDNMQVTSLDQKIGFSDNSTLTFIKLIPLVGG
jgi:hypothetical protein